MKKLFFAVILFTMAIVCLAVGVSCKKKNTGANNLSDYEESLESIASSGTKTSESLNSSDTADTTESVKASEETSISESVSSEASANNPESGKSSETTETTKATETPESSESSEETKPTESTETPESSSTSEGSSESVSESNSESVSDSVASSSEKFDSETVSESETATGTDTEPATDDPWGDSSESSEESTDSEKPSDSDKESTDSEESSDSGDSSESGGTGETVKTVLDIANGNAEELTIEADEVEFTLEFFSILKGKGYTHFKFNAESDGVGDYELSDNKYSPDNGVADIRVEAYRFFDKSVCLKSGDATYIRIYDFVFFSSEETENLTFGDNGYLCYEDEGLVYADYGSGDDYGFKFPDKYFEFERSIENGNAVVTYKISDGYPCGFKLGAFDDNGNFADFNDASGLSSDTSIYISQKKLSEKFVAIRPADRTPIVFNKCELVYSGELSIGKCRPDKTKDGINVAYSGGEDETFYLCLKNAKKVKIIIETESGKDIWIYSDNETSCDVKETNGKYETIVTLSDTGVIRIVIDDCETFRLRYEIIS